MAGPRTTANTITAVLAAAKTKPTAPIAFRYFCMTKTKQRKTPRLGVRI